MEVALPVSDEFGKLSRERFQEQRQHVLPLAHAQNEIDFDSVSLQTCETEDDIFDGTAFNTLHALFTPVPFTIQNVERLNQQHISPNHLPTRHNPNNSFTVSNNLVSGRDNKSEILAENLSSKQIMAQRFLKNKDSDSRLLPHHKSPSHFGRQNSLVGIENTSLINAGICDSIETENVSDPRRSPNDLMEQSSAARPNLMMPRLGGVRVTSRQHLKDTHDTCSVHTEYSTAEFNVSTKFNTSRNSPLVNSETAARISKSPVNRVPLPVEQFEKTMEEEFKKRIPIKKADSGRKPTSAMTCLPAVSFILAILSLVVCSVLIFKILAVSQHLSSNRKYLPCDVMLQLSRNRSLLNDTERLGALVQNSPFKTGNATCLGDNPYHFLLGQRLDTPRTLPQSQFLSAVRTPEFDYQTRHVEMDVGFRSHRKRSGSEHSLPGVARVKNDQGSLMVTKTGHYFLYFGVSLVYGGGTQCSKLERKLLEAAMVKTSTHGHDVKVVVTEHTCCELCYDERVSKFAGGIFHLEVGTKLHVKVSDASLVEKGSGTFMGIWLLHEDATEDIESTH